MIQLWGDADSREYVAAQTLRDVVLRAWPHVRNSAVDNIHILAGVKCHGQRVRDVDILLIARLASGTEYQPYLPFSVRQGEMEQPDSVAIDGLCLAIELKDHSPPNVRITGTTVEVCYGERWHNASEQNNAQVFSIKGYLESHGLRSPWTIPLIWLRNVSSDELPSRPHNILGAEWTWNLLLNVVGQLSPPRYSGGVWYMDAFENSASFDDIIELLTRMIVPTHLDRLRMERINQRAASELHLEDIVGERLLLLRGRGGTGKTVRLLQLARRLYDTQAARVLVLTYNRALVADIRRLLTILNIPDSVAAGSIQVQTVHSFFTAFLAALGFRAMPETSEANFDASGFERLKEEALEYLRSGVVSRDDLPAAHPFSWDYICVDEAQDWPQNERDLLLCLHPFHHVAVADGVDQLVRSQTPTNWRGSLSSSEIRVISLDTSLRMKANLARFVAAFAQAMGLLHESPAPNLEAPGGRVIVLEGSYFADRALHDNLMAANKSDANSPVDMLFCVPPSLVSRTADVQPPSVPGQIFTAWNYEVWDGTSEQARGSYPTSIEQIRIVQYDSCRGLEGWITVNLQLDDFYDYKQAIFIQEQPDQAEHAPFHAARWTMIPMTRAMDTLVIQIHRPHSRVRDALSGAAAVCKDFVDWRRLT